MIARATAAESAATNDRDIRMISKLPDFLIERPAFKRAPTQETGHTGFCQLERAVV